MKKNNKSDIFRSAVYIFMLNLSVFIFLLSCIFTVVSEKNIFKYGPRKVISENFPLSNFIQKIGTNFNNTFGENYSNGICLKDDMLIKSYPKPNNKQIQKNIELLKNIKGDNINFAVVPVAAEVYKNKLPAVDKSYLLEHSTEKFFNDIPSNFVKIDLLGSLSACSDNYIYYRTSDVWTSEGAYYGYKKIITALGLEPLQLSNLSMTPEKVNYFGDLKVLSSNPYVRCDYIEKFEAIKNKNLVLSVKREDGIESSSIFYPEYLNTSDELKYYMGNANGSCKIKTNQIENGSLLLIGDKYADETIQFFINNYKNITYLNLENTPRPSKENSKKYTNVVVLFGADKLENQRFFEKIRDVLS